MQHELVLYRKPYIYLKNKEASLKQLLKSRYVPPFRLTDHVDITPIIKNHVVGRIVTDSYMLDADELMMGAFRLLETDVYPILPTDCEMRFIITSMDVLHSFAVPALGIKVDAIPGRLNQFGIKVRVPGIYFGQCSELCGVGHGFMPIKLKFMYNQVKK
jgi:heme/copper-type cytochrome/quinol oxidase subunit 2